MIRAFCFSLLTICVEEGRRNAVKPPADRVYIDERQGMIVGPVGKQYVDPFGVRIDPKAGACKAVVPETPW